mgnify:CR=1 FL=1
MALFEFEDGHLVPAQFGYPVSHDLGPDLVDAICQQVLQIVSRPLFPVTWRDMTGQVGEETPRLTALDVTGQIVSVEILKLLDSETLITSLSRLAVVASLSWSDLAAEYPSGPEGFRAGWAQFRDSMPPAVGPGPRLIMVAGEIDPSVRPALSILATSGVEVHLMNLRQMSNGRLFLDVNAVGPRLYGHAPQLLGSSSAAPAITAGSVPVEAEASAESAECEATPDATEQDEAPAIPAPPAPPAADTDEENATESETPTTRPTPKVAPHLRDVFHYSVDEEPPAPWKSEDDGQDQAQDAAEEQADEAGADLEDQAEESAEAELEDERGADADEAPSDELVEEETDDAEDADADFDDAERADEGEAGAECDSDDERDEAEDHEGERREDESADEAEDHEDADASERFDEQGQDGDEHVAEENEDSEGEHSGDDIGDCEHDHPEERAVYMNEELDDEEADVDGEQRWERPAHLGSRASRRSHSEPVELNDGGATEAATASFVDREEESPEVVAAREEGVPVLGRDEDGLRTLAQILGEDTPLVARGELGLPNDLVLAASGAISGAGLTYPSLDTMLTARGMSHIDVWSLVRIGDRLGPTLAEALDEVNREIVREYAKAPRERRIARH